MYEKKRRRAGIYAAGTLLIIMAASVGFIIFFNTNKTNNSMADTEPAAAVSISPEPIGLESKLLFMGDVFWGRYINEWSQASPLKFAYPFSGLKNFQRQNYDAWIANLECPSITETKPLSPAQEDATLSFNCNPNYLPEAKKWFDVFSLANNHTDNRGGQKGLLQTRLNLKKQNFQYFGNYDPEIHEDVCEVVAIKVNIKMSDDTKVKGKLPIAFCGYHAVFKIPSAQSLAVMNQYSKFMPVFAVPHAGVEYKSAPDQLKTELFRRMIDNGADAVLAAHPHWVQSAEVYKNHLIVHSMGNFIFDQQYNSEVTRSANIALDLKLKTSPQSLSNLKKWLNLAEQCSSFQDKCLAQAKSQNLKKLAFDYHFSILAGDSSGKLTRPGSKNILNAVQQRLGWQNVIKDLKPPYVAIP